MQRTSAQSLQRWGNSLAIRIPAALTRSAHFSLGQPVELFIDNNTVVIKSTGTPRLSLAQKLAQFDPKKHSGEAISAACVDKEIFK